MANGLTKAERAEMVKLAHKWAESACTGDDIPGNDDPDAIDYPYARAPYYYMKATGAPGVNGTCPKYLAFEQAFISWVEDMYTDDDSEYREHVRVERARRTCEA